MSPDLARSFREQPAHLASSMGRFPEYAGVPRAWQVVLRVPRRWLHPGRSVLVKWGQGYWFGREQLPRSGQEEPLRSQVS